MDAQLSVVIATRNRLDSIRWTVEHLFALTCRVPWQLVIVDNGSSDGTGAWLDELTAAPGMTLTVTSEPRTGAARARNTGISETTGRIVVFIDDDCYATASYLDDVLDVFEQHDLDYIGGRVVLHDPEDLPLTIQTSGEFQHIPPHTFMKPGLIHGANMAFRRGVLAAIGGFDPLLGPGTAVPSADDTDLLGRASAGGFTGAYHPVPTVRHHHRRRDVDAADRLHRAYDIGRGGHYLKSLLRPSTRGDAARRWYWSIEPGSRRGRQRFGREVLGAVRYAVRALIRAPASTNVDP